MITALSTMNMQMEEFYAKAKDADYIIYNSTIDGELTDHRCQLLARSKFSACRFQGSEGAEMSGAPDQNLFQETTGTWNHDRGYPHHADYRR